MLRTTTFKVACFKNRVRTESTEYTKEGLLGALGKNQKHAELKFGVPKGFPWRSEKAYRTKVRRSQGVPLEVRESMPN